MMTERQYLKLRREIEDDCKRRLEALDLVWQTIQSRDLGRATKEKRGEKATARGWLVQAIRSALESFPENFTLHDAMNVLREKNQETTTLIKRSSISAALKRMCDSHEIEIVVLGSGKRASTYRRAANSAAPG